MSDSALELQMKGIQIVCKPIWTTCLLETEGVPLAGTRGPLPAGAPGKSEALSAASPVHRLAPFAPAMSPGASSRGPQESGLFALRAPWPPAGRGQPRGLPHTPSSPLSFCPLGFPDGVSSAPVRVFGGPLLPALLPCALHFITELKLV